MIRAILIIGVIALAVGVIIYSLIDCARSDARDIRGLRPVSYTHLTLPTTPYV